MTYRKPDDDRGPTLGQLYRTFRPAVATGESQFSGITSLSDEQNVVYKTILKWWDDPNGKPLLSLGGIAGSGKTTVCGFLGAELSRDSRVAYCTLTGRAAGVLRRSLDACGVRSSFCGTIHRLMYTPVTDENSGAITSWTKASTLDYDLIIVDEASMVSTEILRDLQSYRVPILAIGDHAQLPPIGEDAGIMANPDLRLETIRRQALDNPIVALTVIVRQGGDWRGFIKSCQDPRVRYLPMAEVAPTVMDLFAPKLLTRSIADDPMVLVGMNRTRAQLNRAARIPLKTADAVVLGERMLCLKNTYMGMALLANGFRGQVDALSYSPNPLQIMADISYPDDELQLRQGRLCKPQIGTEKTLASFREASGMYRCWEDAGILMDYGYAMTVHKCQGAQAAEGLVVVERMGSPEDFQRWLYTAFSRISKRLTIAF